MIENDSLDFNVENDRFCRFVALVALAIAAWHVTLGGQAVAAEVDAGRSAGARWLCRYC